MPPSLFRSLGQFVGHIVRAVTADPANPPADLRADAPRKTVLRSETTEEARDIPGGRVTLRRTTIEEIEVERPNKGE